MAPRFGRFRFIAPGLHNAASRGLLAFTALALCFGAWGCKDKTTNPTPLSRDLVITTGTPVLASSTVAPGASVVMASSWTVKNQGSGISADFANGFYLSTDAVITSSDIYLDGNSNTGLAAGASFPWGGPTTVAIPGGTSPGAYYFGILVDRGNVVAESNESNNYVSTAITVEALLPDLTITTGSPTATPSSVEPNGNFTLSAWTVANAGTVDAGAFSNGFYLSLDTLITSADIDIASNGNASLVAGDSFPWTGPTLTIPLGTAPGTYYVGILVDRANAIAEGDESNNSVRTAITVVPANPDLRITTGSPTPTPSSIRPGGTLTLPSWTVENHGAAPAGLFSNGFYLSTDAVITSTDTYLDGNSNDMGAGELFVWGGPTLIVPMSTTPGTYYIGILVDASNAVAESNESNNYVSAVITVIPGP
jgi:subtilase family serine protease